jgi:ubiquinone/menaquinone biosynthesis C-methylase UbiE
VGYYQKHVVPRLVNIACGSRTITSWRVNVCEGLFGDVLEIGFGTGHNVPYYPSEVNRVFAVEPSDLSWRLATARIAASPVAIERSGLDGQRLSLGANSCDCALVTFTFCTVPDPSLVVAEIWRVLKPGGQLHFLEHGLAPDAGTARWQQILDPLEVRVADGCHLTREPLSIVNDGGFRMTWTQQRYARGPKPWSYFSAGRATKTLPAS